MQDLWLTYNVCVCVRDWLVPAAGLKARTAIQEKRAFNKYLEVMEEEAAQDAAPSFFK